MANMVKIIENGTIGENDIILFDGAIPLMCMTKEVVARLHFHHSFEQRNVAPILSCGFIQNHARRLMGDDNISILRDEAL